MSQKEPIEKSGDDAPEQVEIYTPDPDEESSLPEPPPDRDTFEVEIVKSPVLPGEFPTLK
ncbi:MAG: hypothetical protein WAO95_07450 [Burkholderiales bacterium]